jgi:polysaccharide deacetylase family protein (PEP-CTERM system associated)
MFSSCHILLTVDVEDWFQVENLRQVCPVSSWSSRELRVERNTHRILDLFDQAGSQHSDLRSYLSCEEQQSDKENKIIAGGKRISDNREPKEVRATFFVLGWVAERLPNLVREIRARGHEIASHGYSHELCSECSYEELRKDVGESKRLLEDIIGDRVYGYRAPSFSINAETLRMVREAGYVYDSSYNSFALHGRYGNLALNGTSEGRKTIGHQISSDFFELPISNLSLGGRIFPWGGGGYFRLIPLFVFKLGIKRILKSHGAYLFYLHPWELDADQPRVNGIPWSYRFRHYVNLGKTDGKLTALADIFRDSLFVSCHAYLKGME